VRFALTCLVVTVTVVAAGGTWAYLHLTGNIKAVALFNGVTGDAGHEKADAFGNIPLNVLVIGSDARSNSADCRLGGGCGHASAGLPGGQNADVEMLVHVSADRSNATVMSIPRDTMADVPACTDPASHRSTSGYHGMINSALAYGPGCQVAAVHQLTGIPIDHFAMVDFSGVVTMADAVGGVQVCVSDDVYDTYSHLKLAKGSHVLTGQAALEFVRSRHGFGDGSDLGRTYAQHLYLAALIRALKSAGTLTNTGAVYSLADAATKSLTVDTGLDSIPRLVALAADLNKVPSARTTFTTMQTVPDPANRDRLVVGPGARTLFDTIVNDQPLTPAHPTTGPSSSPASAGASAVPASPTVRPATVPVRVLNGTGVTGRAAEVAQTLIAAGFARTTHASSARPAAATVVDYGPGQGAQAQAVAEALGVPAGDVRPGNRTTAVTVTIGADWTSGTRFPGSAPRTADTTTALDGAHGQTADQSRTCAPVGHQPTVEVDQRIMNPIQAYAYATARGVPDSAP
jgi:LCP family protein required for cell wall assembly